MKTEEAKDLIRRHELRKSRTELLKIVGCEAVDRSLVDLGGGYGLSVRFFTNGSDPLYMLKKEGGTSVRLGRVAELRSEETSRDHCRDKEKLRDLNLQYLTIEEVTQEARRYVSQKISS